jgi:undecaprenyl diphosphate synthase
MLNNDIRLRIIGDRSKLTDELLKAVRTAEESTAHCNGMDLVLAISYGGRDELVNAAKSIAIEVKEGSLLPENINAEIFQNHLYAPEIPDPDLLIRTSSEYRISNFLLWQLAYSEIVVTSVLWPDFKENHYRECLEEYANRTRRYGLTTEQIQQELNG